MNDLKHVKVSPGASGGPVPAPPLGAFEGPDALALGDADMADTGQVPGPGLRKGGLWAETETARLLGLFQTF